MLKSLIQNIVSSGSAKRRQPIRPPIKNAPHPSSLKATPEKKTIVEEQNEGTSAWLLNYRANTFSDQGEDGVIEKILSVLPERDSWCVEFGAWDGKHLSNTRRLITNENYSAVLIEGDVKKYNELLQTYNDNRKVIAVNSYVGVGDDNGLDTILTAHNIPQTFDLLSIDIDGNDFHVWEAVVNFRPN